MSEAAVDVGGAEDVMRKGKELEAKA